ncbi:TetR/AcrR family transcriptional regulator [Candidatus Mycobacterium methanotrophicum]|uniref:TetR/AcrR family transcriptional regulator n=1 Tax=Candidatus Mycobacterium methanotrophicum TaxID=2943498 RepID=A0ABY4QQ91_9MYCO|nr:TetR/AcrR family transcriptional regulator [Candidatus Mycobacterium methanotrophicum]UQX12799.1 TetR/AcrR family transcriptional regulator [Candidatus Mycobacterium methanotrophicum]
MESGQPETTRRPARSHGRLDRSLDTAILDAALAGVAERGYDRLSMDDVASRAGVGKAAIYRRWPSKAVVVADAIALWRRRLGPVEPPNTGSLRGDIEALVAAVPDLNDAELHTIQVVIGVATAAMHNPVLAAALDDLVLSAPRHVVRVVLDQAVARKEIPADRDLSLIPDVALGLNVLRVMTGRPIDRVYARRVLEDVILPLAGAPTR